jgi:DNA-directed RNA polymerase subunit E'/Rpb7
MIARQVIPCRIEYQLDVEQSPLIHHLRKKIQRTCTKRYGFILDILRVIQVHSQRVSIYNGNIIVDCTIEVDRLYPEIDQIAKGVVRQIFPQGTILMVSDCMKVFIPNSDPPMRIQMNEIVEFRVIQTRFQKGKYDCIGKLI